MFISVRREFVGWNAFKHLKYFITFITGCFKGCYHEESAENVDYRQKFYTTSAESLRIQSHGYFKK